MENANAVNPTPEAASTIEPATQAPAAEASPAPAETVVSTTPEPTFDEATQKYLENQNIKGTPNEIVAELVKRNQQLRNQPKVEAVQDVLKQEPVQAPAAQHTLSELDIMNAAMIVEKQYPDVKVDADFYKEMIANGWNPMDGQGIAISRVLTYAGQKQKLAEAEKALAAANQPVNIPSPSNTIDNNSPLQTVQTMDKLAAENIITWSAQQQRYGKERHPQYQQAVDFLQGEARKGSF